MPKLVEVPFPWGGVATESSYSNPLRLGERGEIATTFSAQNVYPFNVATGRRQGSQREGTVKYHADSADSSGNTQIQDIISITTSATPPGDGTLAFRTRTLLVTSDGDIEKLTTAGGFADPGGGTGVNALNDKDDSPVTFSEVFQGVVYFVDGTNYKKYTVSSDTVAAWTASAGSMPANGANKARLIATWQGRIWLAGVVGDEHNWFGSELDDPTDFDYATDYSEDDAVSGNTPDSAGKCRDIINCILPFSSDILLFGCDHTIYAMDGLPTAGGRLIMLTDATGMSWGRPFCFDENGVCYFHGSRGGIYRLASLNEPPQRLTDGKIDNQFTDIDYSNTIVKMGFDSRTQSLFVFLTQLDGSDSTHWRWDRRTNSWWKLTFSDAGHNPTCVYVIDGDDPDDRIMLLGCRDSKIRYFDPDADDDDGEAIDSFVYLGPISLGGDARFRLDELQCTMDNDSDHVRYDVISGETMQDAQENNPAFSGTWGWGKNFAERRRATGRAMYVKIANNALNQSWSLESLYARVHPFGPVEQRRVW